MPTLPQQVRDWRHAQAQYMEYVRTFEALAEETLATVVTDGISASFRRALASTHLSAADAAREAADDWGRVADDTELLAGTYCTNRCQEHDHDECVALCEDHLAWVESRARAAIA